MPFSNRWTTLHVPLGQPQSSIAIAGVTRRNNSSLGNVCQGQVGATVLSCTVAASVFCRFFYPERIAGTDFLWWVAMDVLWMIPLLVIPLLMLTSSTFVFYFKKFFYVAWMMCLALISIPLCILKSGGRDIENMRWVCLHNKCRSQRRLTASQR